MTTAQDPPKDDDAPLREITPERALNLYLKERKAEGVSPLTYDTHERRLKKFVAWFNEETDYTHLRELDGFDLKVYKIDRFGSKDDGYGEYSIHTVSGQMDTLRVFIRFCAEMQVVPVSLPPRVKSPSPGDSGQRDKEIDGDRATKLLQYLDRYRFASLTHALFHTLWYCLLRVGAARSIDLRDIDLKDGYIELHHRPAEDTPLKNGKDSERVITISGTTRSVLADYIATNRHDVEDDYGREPLFTSEHGRPSTSTLRNRIYGITRPCVLSDECPHDRDIGACKAASNLNQACNCPTSESTHAIRRGTITWHLEQETPKQVVSDRADVTPTVLDEHYNSLSEREKADLREDHLPDGLED